MTSPNLMCTPRNGSVLIWILGLICVVAIQGCIKVPSRSLIPILIDNEARARYISQKKPESTCVPFSICQIGDAAFDNEAFLLLRYSLEQGAISRAVRYTERNPEVRGPCWIKNYPRFRIQLNAYTSVIRTEIEHFSSFSDVWHPKCSHIPHASKSWLLARIHNTDSVFQRKSSLYWALKDHLLWGDPCTICCDRSIRQFVRIGRARMDFLKLPIHGVQLPREDTKRSSRYGYGQESEKKWPSLFRREFSYSATVPILLNDLPKCRQQSKEYWYFVCGCLIGFWGVLYSYANRFNWRFVVGLFMFAWGIWLIVHSGLIVTQNLTKKDLTSHYFCITVISRKGEKFMSNVLPKDKQVMVISALAEGSGIRQIERMTGVNRNTIMNLGVRVGTGCAAILDSKMRNLSCRHLQFDEIWGFIGKKERHRNLEDDSTVGDVWTFCAIDADTKVVPAFRVGKRDAATANAFVNDVSSRLKNRVQISSDALRAYVEAVELAFGADVDYAQIIKTYEVGDESSPERKYSPSEVVSVEKRPVAGHPDMAMASTSYIERLNGTTRLQMRRLTRLTYAFSKKLENFKAAVALHFAYYNFVKRHNSLRCTPAMEAGIEKDFWSVENLVDAAS